MEVTECIRILEKQKEAKIKYCQDRGLPIPAFDCEDDYWIPVNLEPVKQYAEVAHGRWEYPCGTNRPEHAICSVCRRFIRRCLSNRYYYCPNCGAKMDLVEKNTHDE